MKIGPINDQLLSNAHARGLGNIDWDDLPSALKSRWLEWASDAEQTVGWNSLVDVVLPHVRGVATSRQRNDDSLTLSELANEVNAVMRGSTPPPWLKVTGELLVAERLGKAQSEATKGHIGFHGTDLADLAACMNLYLESDLWSPLADFLVAPLIPHSQKTAALDRLAGDPDAVPGSFRTALTEHRDVLLAPSALNSPLGPPEPDPFPAAIRLLTAIGGLTEEALLEAMTSLGSGQVRDRLEAARTLAVVAKHDPAVSEWVVSSALHLSNDFDATVRAETGRAIAGVLARTDFASKLLTDRLLDLLNEDGLLVPLLVLQGMAMNSSELTPAIASKVTQMSLEHPAKAVRAQAAFLVG